MRHFAVPAVAAMALTLSACGGGAADTVGIDGTFGEQPTLTFPEAGPPEDLTVDVVSEGNGEEVGAGDFVVADYIGQVWGAESPFNDSFAAGRVAGFSLEQVIAGWQEGLTGSHVGDRVVLSIPPALGYPEGNPEAGIAADDTLVFVVDIHAAFGADELVGQADATDTGALGDLPVTVTGNLGEPATIAVTSGSEAPTELAVTTVAEGTGAKVGETGSVIVSFSASGWDGTDGGSTWDYGVAETIPLGFGSLFDGLMGVPVGSRAVALVPANGDTPAIAAVIDVLGHVD